MIAKIAPPGRRGRLPAPVIYYLYGPGRRGEHTDPHIVAGWWHPSELEPPLLEDGRRDFRRLTGLLTQPHAAMGAWAAERPVWHCSVRAAPEDRLLSDDEWAQIACDVMHGTGLAPYGQEDDAVRWIAVRHGEDHIHIVAMLARQDGRRPRLSNDRYRVRQACLAAEERYGLRRTAAGDRTAAAARPGRSRRKPRAPAWRRPPGSRCGGKSAGPQPRPGASRSSSRCCGSPACWSAPGTARGAPARSPATRSPSTGTPPRPEAPSGSGAENWRLT